MKTLLDPDCIKNVQSQITMLALYQINNRLELHHIEMNYEGILYFHFTDDSYANVNMILKTDNYLITRTEREDHSEPFIIWVKDHETGMCIEPESTHENLLDAYCEMIRLEKQKQ